VLGGTTQFWLTREAQYRAALERRQDLESLREDADWLRQSSARPIA
jgi:HTH-type transcriptional regulator/antitoxin HigA